MNKFKRYLWEGFRRSKLVGDELRRTVRRAVYGKPREPLVFGIGASRTGTNSLNAALRTLGVPAIHWPRANIEPSGGWIDWVENTPWQGYTDNPFSDYYFYEDLDEAFPEARYVLTTRKEESWKESCYEFFQNTPHEHTWEEMEGWNKARKEYEASAKEYFDEDTLLVLPIEAEDKWERLCDFLDKDIPDQPYPHRNKRWSLLGRS